MKRWRVRFSRYASDDLESIFEYIAKRASVGVASDYLDRLIGACESLETAAHRGTVRNDLRPGLRTIGFERCATILLVIDKDAVEVTILGVLYGGRDIGQVVRKRRATE
jgi:toxin ParE1/3/4